MNNQQKFCPSKRHLNNNEVSRNHVYSHILVSIHYTKYVKKGYNNNGQ